MSKVLIIYPPGWIRFHPLHPLGIATLSSFLESAGIECTQVDLDIIAYDINRNSPNEQVPMEDLVDTTLFFSLIKSNKNLRSLLKSYRSHIERLLSSLDLRGIKAVVFSIMGERQFASGAILSVFFQDLGIPTLAGGCYITQNCEQISPLGIFNVLFKGPVGDSVVKNCKSCLSHKLKPGAKCSSVITELDYHIDYQPKPLFSHGLTKYYKQSLKAMYKTRNEHHILQYLIDTGCQHACSFCTRFLDKYRKKTINKIVKEIGELSEEYSTNLFSVVTNAINMDVDFSLQLLKEISHNLRDLEWYAYACPTMNDPRLIELIAKSGCKILRFGLESASNKILRILNKQFSPSQAAEAFRLASVNNIWVQVNLMVGCPNEDEKDIEDTCRFIEKHQQHIDSIRINPFYLQSGSPIYKRPSNYEIKIRTPIGRVVTFDEVGGLPWNSKINQTITSINKVYLVMQQFGIGFYGISSNLLLCALHENQSKEHTKKWLTSTHPYMRKNLSFEAIRWKIYHNHEPHKCPYKENWKSIYGLTFEEGFDLP